MKYVKILSVIFVIVIVMNSFCSPIDDYTKSVLNDISRDIKKTNKSNVIINWEKIDREKSDANKYDFPYAEGKTNTRITKCHKLNVCYLGTNCTFKYDNEGHRAIAYYDFSTNEPTIAFDGFFVIDKVNELTKETKKCKYCINNTGYIVCGWIEENDGTRYYMSEEDATYGEAYVGEHVFADGKTYYFDTDGVFCGSKD